MAVELSPTVLRRIENGTQRRLKINLRGKFSAHGRLTPRSGPAPTGTGSARGFFQPELFFFHTKAH